MLFEDRLAAGRLLGARLIELGKRSVLVLALPRGGVPVGYEVAKAMNAPLDIFLVRKLGVPGSEELAMGAIASGGARVLNQEVIRAFDISRETIEQITEREARELERRERAYRDGRPATIVKGQRVVLVDDGLATGYSMRVAACALRKLEPAQIIVGVPVAAPAPLKELEEEVESVVCAVTPPSLFAVGEWYVNFSQIGDDEVREWLRRAGAVASKAA